MFLKHSLTLDHFYISLSKQQILSIKKQIETLGGSEQETLSEEDSWRGLYLYSRIFDYLEILEDSRQGSFGIALSSANSNLIQIKHVISKNDYQFSKGTRLMESGEKWFDWYSPVDYLNKDTVFNTWIMDYYPKHFDLQRPITPKLVNSFEEINLNLGFKYKEELMETLAYPMFKKLRCVNDVISFEVTKKDGWPFKVVINLQNNDDKFTPISLKLNYRTKKDNYDNLTLQFISPSQ